MKDYQLSLGFSLLHDKMKVLSAILVAFLACQTVNTTPVPFFSGVTSFIGDKITATGNTVNGIKDKITSSKPIKGFKEAVDNTLTFTDNTINGIKEGVDGTLTTVDNALNGAKDVFDNTMSTADITVHGIKDIADVTLNTVDSTVNGVKNVVGTANGIKDFVVGNTIAAAGNTLGGIHNIAEGAAGIFTGAAGIFTGTAHHMGDLMGNVKNELSSCAKKAKGAAKVHIEEALAGVGSLNKKVETTLKDMEQTVKDVVGDAHHSIENMFEGLGEKAECVKKFIIIPLQFKTKYITRLLDCKKEVETAVEEFLADIKTAVTEIQDNARNILSKDALSSMKKISNSIPELASNLVKTSVQTLKNFVAHVKDVISEAVAEFKELLECGKKLKLI